MPRQKKMIRRTNPTVEGLKKIVVTLGYVLLAGIVFFVCWFEIGVQKDGYDVRLSSRFRQNRYYGIFYKESVEVWVVTKNEDGSSQSLRLFPR